MITAKKALLFAIALASVSQVRVLLHKENFYIPKKNHQTEQNIVVFVHGTVNSPRTTGQALKVLRNTLDNSGYDKKTEFMRNDPFFFQSQAIDQLGLIPVDINNFEYGSAKCLFSHIYDMVAQQAKEGAATNNNYYTFGWTGTLSKSARLRGAEKLYKSLQKEVEYFKNLGIQTRITLVGYSHGGNVCLNLAHLATHSPRKRPIIDELILLGTPIQKGAYRSIHNSIFKKIYNIYSEKDNVQIMDWFSTDSLPVRKFIRSKKNKLPTKLKQIRIRVVETKFNKPTNRSKAIITEPTHSHLWFFAWGQYKFEQNSCPLNPVPVGAFLPMITTTADKSQHKNVTIDITLNNGMIGFEQRDPETMFQALMPGNLISKFMGNVQDCIPNNYSDEYNQKYSKSIKLLV